MYRIKFPLLHKEQKLIQGHET